MPAVQLSLPLASGNRPFKLTGAEARLNGDQWAWLFLRLNPLYGHDFDLQQSLAAVRERAGEGRPVVGYGVRASGEVLALDSRYFSANREPLSGEIIFGTRYTPWSLADALKASQLSMRDVRWREFDAPTDYGIAAWINPSTARLPELGGGQSWFHLRQEPIWLANTPAIEAGAAVWKDLPGGQRILVAHEEPSRSPHFTGQLFARDQRRSATELDFLVCLDGYVQPQLARVLPIVAALSQIASDSSPRLKKIRDVKAKELPRIQNPQNDLTDGKANLYGTISSAPSRQGQHWRQVTIDVLASLPKQFLRARQVLTEIQNGIPGMDLRKRSGRAPEDADHWLKKSLAALEFQQAYVKAGHSVDSSITALADAIRSDLGGPMTARGEFPGDLEEQLREALKRGMKLMGGHYEFLLDR